MRKNLVLTYELLLITIVLIPLWMVVVPVYAGDIDKYLFVLPIPSLFGIYVGVLAFKRSTGWAKAVGSLGTLLNLMAVLLLIFVYLFLNFGEAGY